MIEALQQLVADYPELTVTIEWESDRGWSIDLDPRMTLRWAAYTEKDNEGLASVIERAIASYRSQ